jgi:signal transduction histidine kinase
VARDLLSKPWGQRRANENRDMGLPLSIDETLMSHIETDPGLSNAIMSLIQSGEIGIVTVSQAGIVTQSDGILADWAVPGAMVEENAPWLTGLGDRIAAIGLDAAPPLRLEHIAVLDEKGHHDRVVSLNAVTATETGATLLVLRDATQTATLQREVLQQRNALALAEAEVKAAQNAAEAASRAKSDFLAKVNHELRTPLHVVLGNSELLASGVEALTAEERESLADDLLSEGQYLLGLIDDLLNLSRAEAGAPLLEVEAFLVDDVICPASGPMRQIEGII